MSRLCVSPAGVPIAVAAEAQLGFRKLVVGKNLEGD
jgi:hypothetical protein